MPNPYDPTIASGESLDRYYEKVRRRRRAERNEYLYQNIVFGLIALALPLIHLVVQWLSIHSISSPIVGW